MAKPSWNTFIEPYVRENKNIKIVFPWPFSAQGFLTNPRVFRPQNPTHKERVYASASITKFEPWFNNQERLKVSVKYFSYNDGGILLENSTQFLTTKQQLTDYLVGSKDLVTMDHQLLPYSESIEPKIDRTKIDMERFKSMDPKEIPKRFGIELPVSITVTWDQSSTIKVDVDTWLRSEFASNKEYTGKFMLSQMDPNVRNKEYVVFPFGYGSNGQSAFIQVYRSELYKYIYEDPQVLVLSGKIVL